MLTTNVISKLIFWRKKCALGWVTLFASQRTQFICNFCSVGFTRSPRPVQLPVITFYLVINHYYEHLLTNMNCAEVHSRHFKICPNSSDGFWIQSVCFWPILQLDSNLNATLQPETGLPWTGSPPHPPTSRSKWVGETD